MIKVLKEFKEFAIKGNMFDMAIGIIIGMAFNKVVSSLVEDIILPIFASLLGKVKFANLSYTLKEEEIDANGNVIQELVTISYGSFIQHSIDFLIIVLTVFLVVKTFNRLKKKAENNEDKSVPTPREIELLAEIRDLLKAKKP
ncbi:MAG: large-conductance mechanosensitive channel protein MscL [Vicingaceae bacterium]